MLLTRSGTVTIAVQDLRVDDKLMNLDVVVTPEDPDESADHDISLFDVNGENTLDVTLVDPVNLKRYLVVRDSDNTQLAPSDVGLEALNGGAMTGTWVFAAPPPDVQRLDVYFGEYAPLRGVQVQR